MPRSSYSVHVPPKTYAARLALAIIHRAAESHKPLQEIVRLVLDESLAREHYELVCSRLRIPAVPSPAYRPYPSPETQGITR